MPMRNQDVRTCAEIRADIQQAAKNNDTNAFWQYLDELLMNFEGLENGHEQRLEEMQQEYDDRVLAARGARQLTSEERTYYQKLSEAMKAKNPQQALTNANLTMPETIINSVFDDLQSNHPLLSIINFVPVTGSIRLLMDTSGYQEAVWGELCDEIIKELMAGFKGVETGLKKLSAFIPVCKAMLDLGAEWLDRYIRTILYEAIANGMEAGIVTGDGNKAPIGMIREVGDDVTVTGGVYPIKPRIKVNDLSTATVGKLISMLAVDPNGKPRKPGRIILLVSPVDYYLRVMPATTIMGADGTYRNNVMPYPMTIVESPALDSGEAVMGIASRYFAAAGMNREGAIEYSDHYRFLEDERVYLAKTYANGMPKDNNSFLHLDISDLKAATYKVEQVLPGEASADATLLSLSLGAARLSPAFDADTTTYTATTTAVRNTVSAIPADAGASVEITMGGEVIENGTAAVWESGTNTVSIVVTAADGSTTETYTVTVTKS